jgi:hypothetical protein
MIMELDQVVIDPAEARERLAEYEQVIAAERTVEDRALMAAYRAADRGLGVISLQRTFARGGWFETGMPRLAIVRASFRQVFCRWDTWRGAGQDLVFAGYDSVDVNRGALINRHSVRVPVAEPPPHTRTSWRAATTIVPTIPPRYRPRLARLAGFHLLWEVEAWEHIPPVDPALVRHIRGDLWAVVATWDLTPLERLVLAQ